eukprot:358614-Chlamydomonas_euryale.AAC.10
MSMLPFVHINAIAMELFGKDMLQSLGTHTYSSADTFIERPDGEVILSEYLNSIDTSELPPHQLILK